MPILFWLMLLLLTTAPPKPKAVPKPIQPLPFASGLQYPQGACFDRLGNLFVANATSGAISKILPNGKVLEYGSTGGAPSGVAFDARGTLFVADAGRKAILELPTSGRPVVVVDRYQGEPLQGPADLVFSAKGDLYFTDSAETSPTSPSGRIYRLTAEHRLELLASGLASPTGLALSAADRILYVCESGHNRVLAFDINRDGSAGAMSQFIKLPSSGEPTAVRLDSQGRLYIAEAETGKIYVVSPTGKLLKGYPSGGREPSGLAFGGPNKRSLLVTDARGNSVHRLPIGITGLPLLGDR